MSPVTFPFPSGRPAIRLSVGGLALLAFWSIMLPGAAQTGRNVVFLSTSDCHYLEPDRKQGHHNDLNLASIEEMNRIGKAEWPAKLGGGPIGSPQGVVVLGDLINDGDMELGGRNISREQFDLFLKDFGLDGHDGRLAFPVFEGWGNHDGPPEGVETHGFSFQARLKARNEVRLEKKLISHLAENKLHYSWDWGDVHFVQLNLCPADRQGEGVRYSPVWHDPQGALAFLKKDLAEKVGDSRRPVVLMSHYGFDNDWWRTEDWKAAYEAAGPHNVVLYLYGHSATGLVRWKPEGPGRWWDCINDGQTDAGFFVIRIEDKRLRAAYRCKAGLSIVKDKDGVTRHQWGGDWEWKFPLEKSLD